MFDALGPAAAKAEYDPFADDDREGYRYTSRTTTLWVTADRALRVKFLRMELNGAMPAPIFEYTLLRMGEEEELEAAAPAFESLALTIRLERIHELVFGRRVVCIRKKGEYLKFWRYGFAFFAAGMAELAEAENAVIDQP